MVDSSSFRNSGLFDSNIPWVYLKTSTKDIWWYVIIDVTTPFWGMVDCFSTTQFYHEPVRSCFIL